MKLRGDARIAPLHISQPVQGGNCLVFVLKEYDFDLRHGKLSQKCDKFVKKRDCPERKSGSFEV